MISPEYKALLEQEHATTAWGMTAQGKTKTINKLALEIGEKKILDYGAGRGGFKQAMAKEFPEYEITEYEPGRRELSQPPEPHNFVICIDVMEHVEPDHVDAVIDDLKRVTLRYAYVTISTEPAFKILKDGRNAHLTIELYPWWIEKFSKRFEIVRESHNMRSVSLFLKAKCDSP
jgi:hypothetical protein